MENLKIGSVIVLEEYGKRKYVVANKFGGGMGNVYQLIPLLPFSDAVALKTYQKEILKDQFLKEAELWFSVGGHPNIARPYWFGYFSGNPFNFD